MKKIKVTCLRCNGTGLECRRNEVCPTCEGKGYVNFSYIPFEKRKKLRGVKKVIVRGVNLAGGVIEKEISYEQFLKTKSFNLYNLK
jgi:RecJ-like exonuclease